MCNIAGYVGSKEATPILLELIRKQESLSGGYYTGLATLDQGKIQYAKLTGNLQRLLDNTNAASFTGNIGIIHSRSKSGGGDEWAHPFVGLKDGEAEIAYVANGASGIFNATHREKNNAIVNDLANRGYTFLSRVITDGNSYQTLADGTTIHMSDGMCQLILSHMDKGKAPDKAMADAFCEMPSEIVGLTLNRSDPDKIYWSRINCPMFVAFAPHGVYLASSPTAFPEDAGEPILLPANSSGYVSADGYTVAPFTNPPAKVATLNAAVIGKAYQMICNMLTGGEQKPSVLAKEVLPLFMDGESIPKYSLVYQILYSLQIQGLLEERIEMVSGAFDGIDAPVSYFRIK